MSHWQSARRNQCDNNKHYIAGQATAHYISDSRFGRRGGLIIGASIEAFGAILQCIGIICESVVLYTIGRIVIGAGNGIGLNTYTLYVQECTPTSARGTCACFQVATKPSSSASCPR
ncbi:MAG: hypothetical protein CUN55_16690 [Phototrophicales bacterium]|nr:MAG: hypothetical protein CUN55_16690 [Phototrophicales bacterium]